MDAPKDKLDKVSKQCISEEMFMDVSPARYSIC